MPTDELSGRIRLRPLGGLDTVSPEGVIDPRDTPDSGDVYNSSGRVIKRPAFRPAKRMLDKTTELAAFPAYSTDATSEPLNQGIDIWTHGNFLYVSGVEALYQANGATGVWVSLAWGSAGCVTYTSGSAGKVAKFGDYAIIPGISAGVPRKVTSAGAISDLGGTPAKFGIASEYNRMLFTVNPDASPQTNTMQFSGIGTAEIWLNSDAVNAGTTSLSPCLLAPLGDFLLVGHPSGFYRATGYGRASMAVYPFIAGLATAYNAWASDGQGGIWVYGKQPVSGYKDQNSKNTATGIYYITPAGDVVGQTEKISNVIMFTDSPATYPAGVTVGGYANAMVMMEWNKHYDSLFVVYPRYASAFSTSFNDNTGQYIWVKNPAGWNLWNMDDKHRVSGICNGVLPWQVYTVGQGGGGFRRVYELDPSSAKDWDGTITDGVNIETPYYPYWTTPRLAVGTPNVSGRVTNVTIYGSQTSGGGFKLQYRKDSDTSWTDVEPTTSAEYYVAYSVGVGGWAFKTHGVNIAIPACSCRSIQLKIIWPGDSVEGELIGIDIDYVEEGVLQ